MIVEFMGCSSAGKTTLASAVRSRLSAEHVPVTGVPDRLSSVGTTMRHLAVTPGMSARAAMSSESRRYIAATTRRIRDCSLPAFWTAARTAAAIRLTGEHQIRSRDRRGRVISLVDEGILTCVQLAFARKDQVDSRDLLAFAETIAIPDMVVWVDASREEIIERTKQRRDPPREWRTLNTRDLEAFADNTLEAYGVIASSPRFDSHIIAISGVSTGDGRVDLQAARVVDAIRSRLDP
jgi:thymidylate kinase